MSNLDCRYVRNTITRVPNGLQPIDEYKLKSSIVLSRSPLSPASTDVEVTGGSAAKPNVFSVRATFGNAPSEPRPLTLSLLQGDQLLTIDGVSLAAGAMVLLMNHRPETTLAPVPRR